MYALLGPNGARAKTTAMRILTTLSRPDQGRAAVAGIDVLRHPRQVRSGHRRGQPARRYRRGSLTGQENLALQGRLYGLRGEQLRRRTAELLDQLGLADAARRPAKTYSGGMRRRLDVAMVLVHRPAVLFLDEPTTGLDPEGRAELWAMLTGLARRAGTTILVTTHYLEEADQFADRVAIVDRGKIVAEGPPGELKDGLHGDSVLLELASAEAGCPGCRRSPRRPPAGPAGDRGRQRRARPRGRRAAGAARRARRPGEPATCPSRPSNRRPAVAGRRLQPPRRAVVPRAAEGITRPGASFIRQSWAILTTRYLRELCRQPAVIFMSLLQPVVLAAAVRRPVQDGGAGAPGFGGGSYITYLTPGVVIMTAMFSASWTGMSYIEDMASGVMDRFLTAPVSRGALTTAMLGYQAVTTVVQSAVVIAIGCGHRGRLPRRARAASPPSSASRCCSRSRWPGWSGRLRCWLARQRETVIGVSSILVLPLTFLSGAFISLRLVPGWIGDVARYNPVNWAASGRPGRHRGPRPVGHLSAPTAAFPGPGHPAVTATAATDVVPRLPAGPPRPAEPRVRPSGPVNRSGAGLAGARRYATPANNDTGGHAASTFRQPCHPERGRSAHGATIGVIGAPRRDRPGTPIPRIGCDNGPGPVASTPRARAPAAAGPQAGPVHRRRGSTRWSRTGTRRRCGGR